MVTYNYSIKVLRDILNEHKVDGSSFSAFLASFLLIWGRMGHFGGGRGSLPSEQHNISPEEGGFGPPGRDPTLNFLKPASDLRRGTGIIQDSRS